MLVLGFVVAKVPALLPLPVLEVVLINVLAVPLLPVLGFVRANVPV